MAATTYDQKPTNNTSPVVDAVVEVSPIEAIVKSEKQTPPPKTDDKSLRLMEIKQGVNLIPGETVQSNKLKEALDLLRSSELQPDTKIADAQVTFYNIVVGNMYRSTDENFKVIVENLLTFIHANKESYTPRKVNRAWNLLKGLTSQQILEFEKILAIFVATADPSVRTNSARAMNWNIIGQDFVPVSSEKVFDRLKSFYNVK